MSNPADNLSQSNRHSLEAEPAGMSQPGSRWMAMLPMASVVLLSIVLRSGIASIPLERDEGEYAYIAERWLAGDVPYRDAFNQKPPGVFVAYAALLALGFRSVEAIHWLGHVSLVGTLIVLNMLGRRLFSHQVGWIAALFTVILVMDANVLGNAANTEVFAILPLTAAIYFAVSAADTGRLRDALLTGLCGGLALSCKQVALPIVLFAFGWVLYQRWRMSGRGAAQSSDALTQPPAAARVRGAPLALAVSLALGVALVWGPICIYFAARGAWSAFVDCVSGHNLAYAARIPLRYYGPMFWESSKYLYIIFAPIVAAAIAGVLIARQHRVTALRVCIGWLIASFLAVSIGGYYRRHYFILLMPALALIAAYGMEALAMVLEPRRKESRRWISGALAVVSVIWTLYIHRAYYIAESPELVSRHLYGRNPFPESEAIGKLLRENSKPDDRIFLCGSEPQILYFAQRVSATRYIFMYPLFASPSSITRQQAVIEELRRAPPEFVVLVDPNMVPTSYSISHDSPQYFFEALTELLRTEYGPFAASTLGVDGTTRIISPTYNDESGEMDFVHASGEVVTMRIVRRRTQSAAPPVQPGTSENGMKPMQRQLEQNLSEVRGRIERAARSSGRSADAVRLVAVTKTVGVEIASQLNELGVTDLGESRPQELWRKHELVRGPVDWHLIGPLQKNKVRRTLPLVKMMHSIDSVSLLDRVDAIAQELDLWADVLLEVNVSGETAKHGFRPSEMSGVLEIASDLKRVRLSGLMTMAPYDSDAEHARQFFAGLRQLRDQLAAAAPIGCRLTELSMGMSGDFEVAIEEGATIVRVGSALFRGIEEQS